MTKFKTAATYQTRSIGDHNCIFSYKIVSRTAKTITLVSAIRGQRRCKINLINNVETVFPEGKYSMCPVLDATDLAA